MFCPAQDEQVIPFIPNDGYVIGTLELCIPYNEFDFVLYGLQD
jgi:hypothetical protein